MNADEEPESGQAETERLSEPLTPEQEALEFLKLVQQAEAEARAEAEAKSKAESEAVADSEPESEEQAEVAEPKAEEEPEDEDEPEVAESEPESEEQAEEAQPKAEDEPEGEEEPEVAESETESEEQAEVAEPEVEEPSEDEPESAESETGDAYATAEMKAVKPPATPVIEEEFLQSLRAKKSEEKKIGGSLHELEKALATTTSLSAEHKERSRAAINFLSTFEGARRALVLMELGPDELKATAVGSISEDFRQEIPMRLVRRVLTKNRPELLLDAQKDDKYCHDKIIKEKGIRSLMCVPFHDIVTGCRGLLYVDHLGRAGAFSYVDLERLSNFAESLGRDTEISTPATMPAGQTEVLHVEPEPFAPQSVLTVAGVLLLTLLLFFNRPVTETQALRGPESDLPPPQLFVRPYGLTLDFINHVRQNNLDAAYKMLSEEARLELSREEFKKLLAAQNLAGDPAPTVLREKIQGSSARVRVGKPGAKPEETHLWRFSKRQDGWQIETFNEPERGS